MNPMSDKPEKNPVPDEMSGNPVPDEPEKNPVRDELENLRRKFRNHTPGLMGAKREYAVLCPLTEQNREWHLLFEVRAAGIRQGGEVCFPGGRMETGESDIACALRETEEELAIPREEIEIPGRMDFLYSQNGFLLHPVPGIVSRNGMKSLNPSAAEVAEVFTAPLSFFRTTPPEIYQYPLVPLPPENFPYAAVGISPEYPWAHGVTEVPVWYWEGHAVWGMTARMIRGFLRMLDGD